MNANQPFAFISRGEEEKRGKSITGLCLSSWVLPFLKPILMGPERGFCVCAFVSCGFLGGFSVCFSFWFSLEKVFVCNAGKTLCYFCRVFLFPLCPSMMNSSLSPPAPAERRVGQSRVGRRHYKNSSLCIQEFFQESPASFLWPTWIITVSTSDLHVVNAFKQGKHSKAGAPSITAFSFPSFSCFDCLGVRCQHSPLSNTMPSAMRNIKGTTTAAFHSARTNIHFPPQK